MEDLKREVVDEGKPDKLRGEGVHELRERVRGLLSELERESMETDP